MRVLFTSSAAAGHINPILGFAMAAANAGHDVRVAVAEPLRARLEALGLAIHPAGVTTDDSDIMDIVRSDRVKGPDGASLIFGVFADKAYDAIEAAITSFEPDFVFSDSFELAGPILAEKHGIRCALFGLSGAAPVVKLVGAIQPALVATRDRAGLSDDPIDAMMRAPWVFGGLPRFVPDDARLPEQAHHVAPYSETRDALDEAPPWAAALRGKRSVYMTLGTAMASVRPGYMETILEGLVAAELDGVVATTGPRRDPAGLPALPDSFRVARYIPQSFVLPHVAAAVLHGGYGSTSAAMHHGLPLVLIPFGADQPHNAECCARLGVGIVLDKDEMTPETVRAAVREVLDDPGYGERARAVAEELAALPGPGDVIETLLA